MKSGYLVRMAKVVPFQDGIWQNWQKWSHFRMVFGKNGKSGLILGWYLAKMAKVVALMNNTLDWGDKSM